MKFPRLTRSMLLLIRFPAILLVFALLMIVGSRTISSVTDGISMHLFKSARFEEATRAEMEFNDLFGKAHRFAVGDSKIQYADVALALDILWSRVEVLNTESYKNALATGGVYDTAIIRQLRQALPELEKATQALRRGESESFKPMERIYLRFQGDIASYSDRAYSARRDQVRNMVEKEIESLDNLQILQLEYAGLAGVTFLYVLFELYLSHRGNRKLNLAIDEKQHLLISDPLTGIGNRRHFETALQTRPVSDNFSLVLLDLDGFKGVNDTFGHAAGDHLLRHVASVLLSTCGMDDVVCRLGGDEFAVLLRGPKDRAGAFANRVILRLGEPVLFEGNPIKAATSIGVAHSADVPINTTGDMLRNADAALYAAKAAGRNCVQFTSSTLTSASNRKRRLQADLKAAILDCSIDVAYQPIVALNTGETRGIEALVRWNHPEFGAVPPLEIIEAAEQTSQILPLTLYVIDHACATRNHMAACGHDIQVTANVSPGLMALSGFAPAVGEVARRHGMQHGQLLLELTEDAVMAQSEIVGQNVEHFRELGIYLAVDDFGKGYSNLSRLANLEFRKIKLDKSLVDGVTTSDRSLRIARGISRMAIDLGVNVVAEGIESPDQTAVLLELGIMLGQGFHYARPMNALSLLTYLGQPGAVGSISGEGLQLKAV